MRTNIETPIAIATDTLDVIAPGGDFAPAQTANLFRLTDLDDPTRPHKLAEVDLRALRAVADWITSFIAKPNGDLGRAGPVCRFVPRALELNTLWLAPERVGGRDAPDVAQLVVGYEKLFLDAKPVEGEDADYKSIIVVFTDLPADRAGALFDDVLQRLALPSYADDGMVLGGFFETNQGAALYNSSFRPFTAPVPFLLMRKTVVTDWKFFLDKEDWLALWAHRHGRSAVPALAEELRRLPWQAKRD